MAFVPILGSVARADEGLPGFLYPSAVQLTVPPGAEAGTLPADASHAHHMLFWPQLLQIRYNQV